jgi:uncharacterized membrane protein YeiH
MTALVPVLPGAPAAPGAVLLWSGWAWTGSFTALDLLAAATGAFSGAVLVRHPGHFRGFTVVGVLLLAAVAGVGGGVVRDVLVDHVPSALTNPAYLTVAVAGGVVGYLVGGRRGTRARTTLFRFAASFSLPFYAIVGAQKGVEVGLPAFGVLALATVAPTAGRWIVDVSAGVPPAHFVRGGWFVPTALLTGLVWMLCDLAGLDPWLCAAVAFVVGYGARSLATARSWMEPIATALPDEGDDGVTVARSGVAGARSARSGDRATARVRWRRRGPG